MIIYSYFGFVILETGPVIDWTIKYFFKPVLILMLLISTWLYFTHIKQKETRNYNKKWLTHGRTLLRILLLTMGLSFSSLITTYSLILITNAHLGRPHDIVEVNSTVLESGHTGGTGRVKHYYIVVAIEPLNKTVKLDVRRDYEVGDTYQTTLNVGYWGLIYKK